LTIESRRFALRLSITVLVIGILIAISSSAALAVSRPLHPDNISGWIAMAQSHSRRGLQADTPRSQWIVQGTREAGNSGDGHNRWIKSSDSFRPIERHFQEKDDFNSQTHYQYRDPNGQLAAVPEPGSLVTLAGPSLAAILYWRKRRIA
jgi:hypothetical protein